MKNYYTVEEVSTKLGISKQTITERLRKGTLKGERVGREWVIPKEVINKL